MKKTLLFFIFVLFFNVGIASAHPGSLDENGGHWNRSTGEYHYHDGTNTHSDSSTYKYDYTYTNTIEIEPVEIKPLEIDIQPPEFTATVKNTSSSDSTNIKSGNDEINMGAVLIIIVLGFIAIFMFFGVIETSIERFAEIKRMKTEFNIKVISENIYNYFAKVIIHKTKKEYTLQAEIKVVVARTYTGNMTPNITKEIESISYELQRLYWPSKGYISFVPKGADDTYKSPTLTIGTETIVSDIEGNEYTITLTDNIVEESIPQLEKAKKEQEYLLNLKRTVNKDIKLILNTNQNKHRHFARLISNYREHLFMKVAEELKTKQRPAQKATEEVSRIAKEYRKLEEKYHMLDYRLNMYETLIPEIEELNKLPDKELLKLINKKNK